MNRSVCVAAVAVAALVAGCQTNAQPVASAGQGEMVLVCLLKPGVDAAAVVPAANELSKLPGVLDVSAAAGVTGHRVTDSTAEDLKGDRVAFVITFKDGKAAGLATAGWLRLLAGAGYIDKIASVDAYDGTLQNYLVSETFTQETSAADLARRSAALKQQREMYDRTK